MSESPWASIWTRSEEHTSELQSLRHLVCRLLLEKKKPLARTVPRFRQATPVNCGDCSSVLSPQGVWPSFPRVVQEAMLSSPGPVLFFFFNDAATTEIYPLPLHGVLPI